MIVAASKPPAAPMPAIAPDDRLTFPTSTPGTVAGVLVERGSGLGMVPASGPAIRFAESKALAKFDAGDAVEVTGAPDGGFFADGSLSWSVSKAQAYTGIAILTPAPQVTVGNGPAPVTVHFEKGEQVPGPTEVEHASPSVIVA